MLISNKYKRNTKYLQSTFLQDTVYLNKERKRDDIFLGYLIQVQKWQPAKYSISNGGAMTKIRVAFILYIYFVYNKYSFLRWTGEASSAGVQLTVIRQNWTH